MTKEIGVKQQPRHKNWLASSFTRQKFHEDFTTLRLFVFWWLASKHSIFGPIFKNLSKKHKGRYKSDETARPPFPALRPTLIVLLGGIALVVLVFFWSLTPFSKVALPLFIGGLLLLRWRRKRDDRPQQWTPEGDPGKQWTPEAKSDQRPDVEQDLTPGDRQGEAHDARRNRAIEQELEAMRQRMESESKSGTRIIGAPDRQTKTDVIDWD